MSRTTFDNLLDAGVHFGHLKRKWNPNMAPYIFMERNGIHIIDLYKTIAKIDEAASALKQIAKSGCWPGATACKCASMANPCLKVLNLSKMARKSRMSS